MNDDQMLRAAASGLGVWMYWLIIQKAKSYLSARRDETGRSFEQRVAYRLGSLWARCHRAAKQALQR